MMDGDWSRKTLLALVHIFDCHHFDLYLFLKKKVMAAAGLLLQEEGSKRFFVFFVCVDLPFLRKLIQQHFFEFQFRYSSTLIPF